MFSELLFEVTSIGPFWTVVSVAVLIVSFWKLFLIIRIDVVFVDFIIFLYL